MVGEVYTPQITEENTTRKPAIGSQFGAIRGCRFEDSRSRTLSLKNAYKYGLDKAFNASEGGTQSELRGLLKQETVLARIAESNSQLYDEGARRCSKMFFGIRWNIIWRVLRGVARRFGDARQDCPLLRYIFSAPFVCRVRRRCRLQPSHLSLFGPLVLWK